MKNIIRLAALCLALSVAGFGAATVSAHVDLESSDPAAGAVLATSPASVTLTFVAEIQKIAGSYALTVEDASGGSVGSGAPSVAADAKTLSVTLKPNLPDGVYTVHWTNTSADDGDAISGEFSFTVGAAASTTPAPAATPAAHGHDDTSIDDEHTDENAPPTTGFIVLAINAQHDSGVSGRAELFPVDGGSRTRIDVYLSGMEPGTSHMTHVHNNLTCDEAPGAHAADLNNVVADNDGSGMASSTADVAFSTIADGRHIILSHVGADAQGDKTTISCGDIPAQPEAHDAHVAIALPSTGTAGGGSNVFAMFATLAVVALAGTIVVATGAAVASRRR